MNDSNDKVMGVLSYFNLLCLIPICLGNTPFVKFHANQGLVLAIIEIIFSVLIGVFVKIPVLGIVFSIVGGIIDLICLCLAIYGIVTAVNGEMKEIPVIGAIKLIK